MTINCQKNPTAVNDQIDLGGWTAQHLIQFTLSVLFPDIISDFCKDINIYITTKIFPDHFSP